VKCGVQGVKSHPLRGEPAECDEYVTFLGGKPAECDEYGTLPQHQGTGQLWGKKYGPGYLPIPLRDKATGMAFMPCYKVTSPGCELTSPDCELTSHGCEV
jgi:hypothetical protein